MRKIILGLLLIILAVAITACQSNNDTTNNYTPPNTTDNETDNDEPARVEDTYDEFKDLLQENPEYQVEYELTYSDGDQENMIIYTKNNVTRIDFKNEDTTVWMNDKQVVEYEGECIDLSMTSNLGFNPESIYQSSTVEGSIKTEDEYVSSEYIGTRSIASKTVDCYEFIYETDTINQVTTYCLTNKGIPALIETKDRDTDNLISRSEALTIDDSVSDDVLEPCDVTVDISDMIY